MEVAERRAFRNRRRELGRSTATRYLPWRARPSPPTWVYSTSCGGISTRFRSTKSLKKPLPARTRYARARGMGVLCVRQGLLGSPAVAGFTGVRGATRSRGSPPPGSQSLDLLLATYVHGDHYHRCLGRAGPRPGGALNRRDIERHIVSRASVRVATMIWSLRGCLPALLLRAEPGRGRSAWPDAATGGTPTSSQFNGAGPLRENPRGQPSTIPVASTRHGRRRALPAAPGP